MMRIQQMTPREYVKALGIGIGTAAIISMIQVPAFQAGLSPLPKPLALAFAQTLLGDVPLPTGLLFHVMYITFWSFVYIMVFKRRTFPNALFLALMLWVAVLVFFFPVVGWGFLGLAVSPKLIAASLVPHFLFAVILWGLTRWLFRPRPAPSSQETRQEEVRT